MYIHIYVIYIYNIYIYIQLYIYSCLVDKLCLILSGTPWTVAHQATLSIGFSREEYWSGLSFPFSGGLLDPGI